MNTKYIQHKYNLYIGTDGDNLSRFLTVNNLSDLGILKHASRYLNIVILGTHQ